MATSQDFEKGIDITGLSTITGSQINQSVDAARCASDKGINIITTDTALDTPDVPDPSDTIEGVEVTFWQRYKWIRRPFADAGADARVKEYVWNPNKAEDATLLQWEYTNEVAEEALETAEEALTDAATAITDSATASALANTASATAETARASADTALSVANTAQVEVDAVETTVSGHETRIDALEAKVIDAPLPIANGGTGSNSISGILAALGLSRVPVAYATFKDVKTQGTDGGTFTSGAWQTRDLNVESSFGVDGATLAANVITLTAGSYLIEAEAPAFGVESHQARLYNITSDATEIYGSVEYAQISGGPVMTKSKITGLVNIAASTQFRIEHQCEDTIATNGLGRAASFGSEIYTQVKITKLYS